MSILQSHTFVCTIDGMAEQLISPVIIHYNGKLWKGEALWDTGAFCSAISQRCADAIGFESSFVVEGTGFGGKSTSPGGLVDFVLPNDVVITEREVSVHPNLFKHDIVIGMNVIHCGDFVVSNDNEQTIFAFRYPAQGIEGFTKDE